MNNPLAQDLPAHWKNKAKTWWHGGESAQFINCANQLSQSLEGQVVVSVKEIEQVKREVRKGLYSNWFFDKHIPTKEK